MNSQDYVIVFIAVVAGVAFLILCCWTIQPGRTQTVIAVATLVGQEPRLPPPIVQIQLQQQAAQLGHQQDDQPKGLDKATIDSYPRVVIGASGQLLQQDDSDNACSICLIEYQVNDTLRILPQCLHRFHVDCVDEWLSANGTCPVCRIQPPAESSIPLD